MLYLLCFIASFDHLLTMFYIIHELKGQVRCIVIRIGRDNSSASLTCLDISLAIPVPQLIATSSSLTWRESGAEKKDRIINVTGLAFDTLHYIGSVIARMNAWRNNYRASLVKTAHG